MTSDELLAQFGPRESMEYDVVVVGAGPAGLSTAIRLKQLQPDVSVVVLEKGSEPGAHILSGAVMDPRALQELFPDWKERGAQLNQPVTSDDVLVLDATGSRRTPDALVPECFHNEGCFVIRLGALTKWLAEQAESLGVEIFPGFAAAEVLYTDSGAVRGVAGVDNAATTSIAIGGTSVMRAQFNGNADGSAQPLRAEFGQKNRDAKTNRHSNQQCKE